jgi:transketolase
MRNIFADMLLNEMKKNDKIIVITADIGYGILDTLRMTYPERVINVGSSEMLMVGIAVGLSYEGFLPICYTITSFLLYRPFEMIRNYINYENLNIKLVGSGRDKDYIHDGITHWAEDDVNIISNCFPNITIYKPDVLTQELFDEFIEKNTPCYLNLKRNI